MRNYRAFLCLFCLLTLLTSCTQMRLNRQISNSDSLQTYRGSPTASTKNTYMQVLLGVSKLDEDEMQFEMSSSSDPTVSDETDLSTMPFIGVAGQEPLFGNIIEAGIEGGILFSWWRDSVSAVSYNGALIVHIKNKLILTDLFIGPYLATRLGEWGRIYAGAGPVLMYGVLDTDNEDIDNNAGTVIEYDDTDTALGLGVYARAGIEFKLRYNQTLGLGVRGVKTELDFNDTVGEIDIQGVQAMLTYGFYF